MKGKGLSTTAHVGSSGFVTSASAGPSHGSGFGVGIGLDWVEGLESCEMWHGLGKSGAESKASGEIHVPSAHREWWVIGHKH